MICLRETRPREDTEILTRREGTRMCEIYARFGFDGGMFAAYSLRVVEGTSRVVVGVPAAGAGSRPTVRVHFMCVSPLSRSCLVSCADARRASEVGPQPSSPATYLRPIVNYRTTWLMNVNVNTFGNACGGFHLVFIVRDPPRPRFTQRLVALRTQPNGPTRSSPSHPRRRIKNAGRLPP